MFFFKYTNNEDKTNNKENEPDLNSETINTVEEAPKTNYRDTLDKIEMDHIDLMERIAKPCRSTHERFTDVSKLDAIRKELEDSPYKETYDLGVTSIWTKVPFEELPSEILLVSSHIDVVPNITHCYSELDENGFLHGTYDNLATNAAEVIMMKEEDFPNNIVFAFNGDEETGGCAGAKEVAKKLVDMGKNVNLCVALDVTWEGFDDDKLFSLENLTYGKLGFALNEFVARSVLRIENDETDFCFIKANKHNIPKTFQINCPEVIEKSTGMYDEAFAYRDVGLPACSICIPTDGDMHSNSGLYVKQPVFEGYILSLTSFLYSLCKEKEYLIDSYKVARQNLTEKAKAIEFIRPKSTWSYYNDEDYSITDNNFLSNPGTYTSYYEDRMIEEMLLDQDRINADSDWYIPEFSEMVSDLIELAREYGPGCEEEFISELEIPDEFKNDYAINNYEHAHLTKEEKKEIDNVCTEFLRGIYQSVYEKYDYDYNGENYMDYMDDDDDEYGYSEKSYQDIDSNSEKDYSDYE